MKKILVFLTVTLMLSVIVSCDSSEELLPQEEQTTYELRTDPILPYSRAVFLDGVKYYVLGEYPDEILDDIVESCDIPDEFKWTGHWYNIPATANYGAGIGCKPSGTECKPTVCEQDGVYFICGFVDVID